MTSGVAAYLSHTRVLIAKDTRARAEARMCDEFGLDEGAALLLPLVLSLARLAARRDAEAALAAEPPT